MTITKNHESKSDKPKHEGEGLRPNHYVFVHEYVIDRDGKRAAIAAGFSPKTAESQASRLLRNVKVRAAIDAALLKLGKKCEVTAERVIREIARIAFQKLSKEERKQCSGNKLRALELLGKHFKLFTEQVQLSGTQTHKVILLPDNGFSAPAEGAADES